MRKKKTLLTAPSRDEIFQAMSYVLDNKETIPPPPEEDQVENYLLWLEKLEKWAKKLPQQVKLGMLAIYFEWWEGDFDFHKPDEWEEWLHLFTLRLNNRYKHPTYLYNAYHLICTSRWRDGVKKHIRKRLNPPTKR